MKTFMSLALAVIGIVGAYTYGLTQESPYMLAAFFAYLTSICIAEWSEIKSNKDEILH